MSELSVAQDVAEYVAQQMRRPEMKPRRKSPLLLPALLYDRGVLAGAVLVNDPLYTRHELHLVRA